MKEQPEKGISGTESGSGFRETVLSCRTNGALETRVISESLVLPEDCS